MTSEEEEEKPVGDENNHSQFEEEKKKHKSSEVEVSDNVCDTADESGLIQQGKNKQEFAAMENEGSDSSDPGMHRMEVKKKDTSKWTPEECVIAPIFEKTDSLTGGLLHVNDDSILSEVDQDDDRSAKKTSNENNKVKTLQEDPHKAELEKYKQLYLVELEVRKSLEGKLDRTALHLACANGHSVVVTLLLERKCLLNLCDNENRTVLMKALECQEEECATLLLEHGADPNVMDISGNTTLLYAVFCQNISLAAKLLSCDANIEARNKDDLTPLSLVICERRGQMVEFLVKKEANIHAVDKMKRLPLELLKQRPRAFATEYLFPLHHRSPPPPLHTRGLF
ncbi:hypothetical protein MG293_013958 [Ovis ammon polii]|uniref:Uncharacterized protein n=1 Tax=Ovis ammon polii TaxID=230172 RepID=A0AAD4Y6T2_OVIAM|nr:hypothetical protein MG293_013958 [Ovis ammon polii]